MDSNYLKDLDKYKFLTLDAQALRKFAQYPENELTEVFLRQAENRGDKCCVLLDGERLASYVWSTTQPANVVFDKADDGRERLRVHFCGDYVYRYKSYTPLAYRGQRLMAYVAACSLRAYLQQGFKGMICYVEANNYSSLKSVYRMGYRDFGKVYIVRILGKYLIYSSRGCKEYGFKMEAL